MNTLLKQPNLETINFQSIKRPSNPEVSILISIFNGELTIERALQSIVRQTFSNYELIIINDSSTDDTDKIIRSFKNNNPHLKIAIIQNPTRFGLTKSLNIGLALANGDLIARLDADDWWHEEKLSLQVKYMNSHPKIGVLGSAYSTYFSRGYKHTFPSISNSSLKKNIYSTNPFGHSTVMIRTQVLKDVRGYDETIYFGQDRDLWFRLLYRTQFHNLKPILCYRSYENSISSSNHKKQMLQGIKTRLKFIHLYKPGTLHYIHFLKPSIILLTPNFARRLFRIFSLKNTYSSYRHIAFVNDRPLNRYRAETVARKAMAEAFLHDGRIRNLKIVNTTPILSLFATIPKVSGLIYLRCGALASAGICLRNYYNNKLIILEIHNMHFEKNILANYLYRLAFKRANLLVTISELTKLNWSHLVSKNKITVLPSGVDRNLFTPRKKTKLSIRRSLGLPLNKKIVVYHGSIYKHRGIEDIISAANIIPSDYLILIIGGTKREINYYKKNKINDFASMNNISWLGHLSQKTIALYLQASDLSIVTYNTTCPTISTMSPLKILEAMSTKTPILAADVPRIKEILTEQEAYFYQPDIAKSLAINITKALNDKNAQIKASKAYVRVTHRTWQHRADTILTAINI